MNRAEINEFFIDKDGLKIHAKLEFPENSAEKLPVVLMLHGLTGHMEEWHLLQAAKACLNSGAAVLRVELYGHGQSDGAFVNHTITEWVEQTIFLIDYVKKLDFCKEIYLLGHSQGGLTAILAGGLKADLVKSLILLSPAICIIEACKTGQFFDASFDAENIPKEIVFWGSHVLGNNYLRTSRILSTDWAVEAFKGPVLCIHGEADGAVPCSDTVEVAKKYSNAEMVVLPNDGHCYELHWDMMAKEVETFVKKINS